MNRIRFRSRVVVAVLLAASLSTTTVHAQSDAASDASALSALPIAVSVAAPVLLVSGGAMLTVAAVEASANGAVWVLERVSDGARCSLQLAGAVAGGASTLVGSAVLVTAVGAGWVLSTAGRAIAFVPNRIGAALLYDERVTR